MCEFILNILGLEPVLQPLDRNMSERAAGLLTALVERPADEDPARFHNAIRDVHEALQETRLYLKRRSEGEYRDATAEERLSHLWFDASFRLRDFGFDRLADLCLVKGNGCDPQDLLNCVADTLHLQKRIKPLVVRFNPLE
jgi:hypothetical protein